MAYKTVYNEGNSLMACGELHVFFINNESWKNWKYLTANRVKQLKNRTFMERPPKSAADMNSPLHNVASEMLNFHKCGKPVIWT